MNRRDANYYFRLESEELICGLEAGLLAHGSDAFDLPELFRKAHTLKGAARVVGHEAISELAHTLEDVLAVHRETHQPFSRQELTELLSLVDALRRMMPAANDNLRLQAQPRSAAPRELEHLRIELGEMDELTAEVLGTEVHASSLRSRVDALTDLKRLARSLVDEAATQTGQRAVPPRLRAGLDELLAGLEEQRSKLANLADQLEVDLSQLGERATALRLVGVALLFPELERCARDAASALGRSVSFAAQGGSVRVDGHVINVLRGALVHLVRNAIAHGIEGAAERIAAGKPAAGSVRVEVRRNGQRIRIAVHDDGRGIDHEAVRKEVERRGLAGPNSLRPAEDWIFEPGLSTAREVSAIAGRGVGLDAVRQAVERCKGRVHVRTQAGTGSCFELDVPVSLSAITALSVEVAGRSVLLPLSAVSATLRMAERDVLASGGDACILYEGRAVPFRRLGQALALQTESEARVAVIVQSRGQALALGVEALRSSREVIVRSLPRALGAATLFLGASFDASGNPELVLDPDALSELPARAALPRQARATRKPILIIDDSLTTRMLEQSILDAAGYAVDLACSAEEGLHKALTHDFGLIVVDVEMPGRNGYEFTREARATSKLSAIPIIMVTSLASDESRRRAREAGVSAYIVKGEFDQKSFLGMVAELLP